MQDAITNVINQADVQGLYLDTGAMYRAVTWKGPEETAFDRFEASHAINLFDMNCKYADVIPTAEVLDYMKGLPRREV